MTAETATVSSLQGACERKTLQGWFCEDAFTLMMLCSECALQTGKKKEWKSALKFSMKLRRRQSRKKTTFRSKRIINRTDLIKEHMVFTSSKNKSSASS